MRSHLGGGGRLTENHSDLTVFSAGNVMMGVYDVFMIKLVFYLKT